MKCSICNELEGLNSFGKTGLCLVCLGIMDAIIHCNTPEDAEQFLKKLYSIKNVKTNLIKGSLIKQ